MTRDPGIICFEHCNSRNIFCKRVPEICPLCQSYILGYIIEPFRVPYPYTNAAHQPAALIVKPSRGNFLTDYNTNSDLHIGITNSDGIIFEYDKEGIIINDHSKWTDCIAIKIIPSSWDYHWDETLGIMLQDVKWKSENYNEFALNCFNFVIEFLSNLQYMNIKFVNKENLCDKLILPKIQDAVKYNFLFKKLETTDYFVSS